MQQVGSEAECDPYLLHLFFRHIVYILPPRPPNCLQPGSQPGPPPIGVGEDRRAEAKVRRVLRFNLTHMRPNMIPLFNVLTYPS